MGTIFRDSHLSKEVDQMKKIVQHHVFSYFTISTAFPTQESSLQYPKTFPLCFYISCSESCQSRLCPPEKQVDLLQNLSDNDLQSQEVALRCERPSYE